MLPTNPTKLPELEMANLILKRYGINFKNFTQEQVKQKLATLNSEDANRLKKALQIVMTNKSTTDVKTDYEKSSEYIKSLGINPLNLTPANVVSSLQNLDAETKKSAMIAARIVMSGNKLSHDIRPPWAVGITNDATIHREDYSDPNFIRKRLWELSASGKQFPITLWSYNGKRLAHLMVISSSTLIPEMIKAVTTLDKTSKAIMLSGINKKLMLIWLNGKPMYESKPPIIINDNYDPEMTQSDFLKMVRDKIESIENNSNGSSEEAKPDVGFKAWLNIRSNVVFPIKDNASIYSIFNAENPKLKMFGLSPETVQKLDPYKLRILIEREGWFSVGVAVKDDKVIAAIQTRTKEQAYEMVRRLFKLRYTIAPWDKLVVKYNEGAINIDGKENVLSYVKTGKNPNEVIIDT